MFKTSIIPGWPGSNQKTKNVNILQCNTGNNTEMYCNTLHYTYNLKNKIKENSGNKISPDNVAGMLSGSRDRSIFGGGLIYGGS